MLVLIWLMAWLSIRFEKHEYTQPTAKQLVAAQAYTAQAYLAANFEPLIAGWQWTRFSAAPEVELRTGEITPLNPLGTVIIVPGFTSPIEMQARAISTFYAAGYKVAALDYRGQGGSWRPLGNPEKGYVENYDVLADDLAGFANSVKIAGKPLFFHSISKGAHITMRMAETNAVAANGFSLVVPMIEINPGPIGLDALETISSVASFIGLGQLYAPGGRQWPTEPLVFGKANDCNANPDTAQLQSALFAHHEALRVSAVTLRWIEQSIGSGKRLLSSEYAQNMPVPVRMFTAGDDRIVSTPAAQQFCNGLQQCTESEFTQSRHCINRENIVIYDEILHQSIDFFKRHSPR